MEREQSSIEILKQFARRSGRNIEVQVRKHNYSIVHPVRYHQRSLYIPNNTNETSYFICYGDSGAPSNIGEKVLYSGTFIPVDLQRSVNIKIRKKDILDKLSFFKKKKFLGSGFREFDAKTTIRGNDSLHAHKLLNSRKVRETILETLEYDASLTVGLNTVNADFVPRLKGQSYLGVYSLQGWMLEDKTIEQMFGFVEQMRTAFS